MGNTTSEVAQFGERVEFPAIVGRLRKFRSRVGDEYALDSVTLDYGHGRRPAHHYYFRDQREWECFEVLCEAKDHRSWLRYASPDTLVDIVRVPVEEVRGWWPSLGQEPDVTPMRGVVIGLTRRHAGRVSAGYDEGNSWTTTGTVSVVTVAVETGGSADIYDVEPADLTRT